MVLTLASRRQRKVDEMSNQQTLDRRDVAHPTNPIGGQALIEQIEEASPSEDRESKRTDSLPVKRGERQTRPG